MAFLVKGAAIVLTSPMAPLICRLLVVRRRLLRVLTMMHSVPHAGQIARHGGTLSIFIGGRDGVGGGDARNATSRGRLLLIMQDLFQLLLHLCLVENPISLSSLSGTASGRARLDGRGRCGITSTSSTSSSSLAATTTPHATSSSASTITAGRWSVLTRDMSGLFFTRRGFFGCRLVPHGGSACIVSGTRGCGYTPDSLTYYLVPPTPIVGGLGGVMDVLVPTLMAGPGDVMTGGAGVSRLLLPTPIVGGDM